MKKMLITLLAVILAVSLLSGCVPKSSSVSPTSDKKNSTPLRVGIMPSAVGAPVQYALEKGYFDEEGVNVEIVIFPSGAPINEAMAAKQIDVACSGAASIFSLANGTGKLIADVESSGGMGIWVRPDSDIMTVKGEIAENPEMYGSAETIKGKTFLATLGTASQFNVLRYIERFGLKEGDIKIQSMEFGPAAQAFIAGEGDAIATFAPYSSQVTEKGAVMCTTFEDATQTALYDMMFARTDIVESRRDDLVKFTRAFERAVEDLSNDDVRREFSMKWFADNGRTYTDDTMTQELHDRRYVTKETMGTGDYVLGDAMPGYAQFNVDIGKIEKENLKNIDSCIDPTILEDAIGIDIKIPSDK